MEWHFNKNTGLGEIQVSKTQVIVLQGRDALACDKAWVEGADEANSVLAEQYQARVINPRGRLG